MYMLRYLHLIHVFNLGGEGGGERTMGPPGSPWEASPFQGRTFLQFT